MNSPDVERPVKAEDVIAFARSCEGIPCPRCGVPLIGHDAVIDLMLGFADELICSRCLARHLERDHDRFLENVHKSIARLPCYRAGWRDADERLAAAGEWPEDRIPKRLTMSETDEETDLDDEEPEAHDFANDAAGSFDRAPDDIEAAIASGPAPERWDAGDRGCGELALELKLRLRRLEEGARFLLTTTDRGAPADLPAWCRLTGHSLVAARPPEYLIEIRSPAATP